MMAGLVVLEVLCNGAGAPRATAQVNIEAQRSVPADSGFSGTLATDLLLRTGNVEHFRLGVGGRVDFQTKVTSTFLVGRGNLGLLGTDRFNSAGLVHLRHSWHWRPQLMPEAYGQINYDEPRKLAFRALFSGTSWSYRFATAATASSRAG